MTKSTYSPENLEAYKYIINDIELSKELKREGSMVTIMPTYLGEKRIISAKGKCACGNELRLKVGNFSKHLDEVYVPCDKGTNKEGHGIWAQVVNVILN